MSGTLRGGSSCLLKLVGLAVVLGGLSLGAGALMVNADASIQMLMGVIALGGLLIAVLGGALLGLGALLGGGKMAKQPPQPSPEERQLRDSRAFQAFRDDDQS